MKYWKDEDVEHIDYAEGCRVLPHNHPAAIATSDNMRVEVEIVPNTIEVRNFVDPRDFEMTTGKCVQVERRRWRNGGQMFSEVFWVPLHAMGYDKEPDNSAAAFDVAMEIV